MKNNAVPDSKGEVAEKFLKFKPTGLSVEEARTAMLEAKEEATTIGGGTKIPLFLREAERGQGGNIPVNGRENPSQSLLASARDKLSKLRVPLGSRINLNKMRDAGYITQPEIDALMAAGSGKTPDIFEPAPSVQPEPAAVQPTRVPVVPEPVVSGTGKELVVEKDPIADSKETIDTKHFTAQIYKDGREWVAELIYKNGSGSERFTAPSIRDLNRKLIEAKGNATIKVRDTVRRMKLGDKPDTWDFFFEQVKESHGLTIEEYNALPEASRALVQDTVQAQQILAFTEAHPDYYATEKNFLYVADYLNKLEWPLTLHNLELAYYDLSENDILESRPKTNFAAPVATAPSSAPTVVTAAEDSAAVVAEPPRVSTQSVPLPTTTAVRKRGSTGLMPGDSSAVPSEPTRKPEEGNIPTEPSESELRKMPMAQLTGLAKRGRVYGRQL